MNHLPALWHTNIIRGKTSVLNWNSYILNTDALEQAGPISNEPLYNENLLTAFTSATCCSHRAIYKLSFFLKKKKLFITPLGNSRHTSTSDNLPFTSEDDSSSCKRMDLRNRLNLCVWKWKRRGWIKKDLKKRLKAQDITNQPEQVSTQHGDPN